MCVISKERVIYDCPLCDEEHEVVLMTEIYKTSCKDDIVEVENTYYFCERTEEQFVSGKMMNKNLLKIKDSYRKKHDLLISSEIINIREHYNLTQKEFSNLFGWEDDTIRRYERKAIQDEVHDQLIRKASNDPLFIIELLELNKDKFELDRFNELLKNFKAL